jgi:hypothetical protein
LLLLTLSQWDAQGGKKARGKERIPAARQANLPNGTSIVAEYAQTYHAVVSCATSQPDGPGEPELPGGARLWTALVQATGPQGPVGADVANRASHMARAGTERWRASTSAIVQSCNEVRKEALPLAVTAGPQTFTVHEVRNSLIPARFRLGLPRTGWAIWVWDEPMSVDSWLLRASCCRAVAVGLWL